LLDQFNQSLVLLNFTSEAHFVTDLTWQAAVAFDHHNHNFLGVELGDRRRQPLAK
jgi:hypothetical protein